MRIAFFTDTFLPQLNGVVTAVVELAEKLADRGHRIYIVAPKFPKGDELIRPNITVRHCKSVPVFFYEDFKLTLPLNPFVLKFVVDNKIDIIHFHTPIALGFQAVVIAKLLKLPLIGTFHTFFADPQYLKHVKLDYAVVEKIAWNFSNFFYNSCDIVVCPSEGTKAKLISKGCKKAIKVIPHGIDLQIFDNSKSEAVREKYNKNGKLVLFVGRIAHEKNLPYLLECFKLVLKKIPAVKLIIVGSGPQLPEVKAKAAELGIGRNVIFTGRIEHSQLIRSGIFGACDIFLTASTTETGPLTVLEAQANGLVCISVKGKGMDVIKDNVNGYVINPGDKQGFANSVIKLLTEKREYARMRKATLRMIKKYELAKITDTWEETYDKLISKNVRNRRS